MEPLGLYIHIPFCKSKCAYCDFYSLPACTAARMDAYTAALCRHLSAFAPKLRTAGDGGASGNAGRTIENAANSGNITNNRNAADSGNAVGNGYAVDTVYFGGGTPSCLGERRLLEIWETVARRYPLSPDAEVTLEANPESCGDWLASLKAAGFNRVSLGMQSADDGELRDIGRVHNAAQTRAAVEAVRRAGFGNLSLDLIYGLPGQTRARWRGNVRAALDLSPEHISCYGLKVEEGTPLYKRQEAYSSRGKEWLPGEEEQAAFYLWAVEELDRAGYRQYEISNFARPGRESRHNLKYWTLAPYIGFGPGAHSDFGGVRYAWTRDLDGYMRTVQLSDGRLFPDGRASLPDGHTPPVAEYAESATPSKMMDIRPPIAEYAPVPQRERAREYVMLGLRTSAGLDSGAYARRFRGESGPDAAPSFDRFLPFLEQCRRAGYAVREGERWRLTARGFLVSNQIIGGLLDAWE